MSRDVIEKILKEMKKLIEEKEERIKTLIREDFNAKTGREREGVEEKKKERSREGKSKQSRDEKVNGKERR